MTPSTGLVALGCVALLARWLLLAYVVHQNRIEAATVNFLHNGVGYNRRQSVSHIRQSVRQNSSSIDILEFCLIFCLCFGTGFF